MNYKELSLRVSRTARWGQLGELTARTREVWMALHGYAQLAASFAAWARWPASPERAFVFPEALQRFYVSNPAEPLANRDAPVAASWMTREARTDDIADNHTYLDALWDAVRANAPHAALTVLGFSQGGATAVRWTAERAAAGAPPARLIVWGGAIPEEVDLSAGAPLRRVPLEMVFGERDRWATPDRVAAEHARLAAAQFPAIVHRFDGGHRLDDDLLAQLASSAPSLLTGLTGRP